MKEVTENFLLISPSVCIPTDHGLVKALKHDTRDRKSHMRLGEVYFWTDTIKDWNRLLLSDVCKNIIIECWQNLVSRNKIRIYAFVIMPNHIHVVWEMIDMNGKEKPHASFNKYSAHQFLEYLRTTTIPIKRYQEATTERKHRFWQRDALAVLLRSKETAEQKIDYIHLNPLQSHWNLVIKPEDYRWSSASFYEKGIDEFGILTDYRERF